MKFKKKYLAIIIILGIIGVAYINSPTMTMANEDNLVIRSNERNQKYGSNLSKINHSMDENGNPNELDLILVEADNGEIGYVYKEDFYDIANQPKNPEEAVVYMEKLNKNKDKVIPVYTEDGITVIGSYKIGSK